MAVKVETSRAIIRISRNRDPEESAEVAIRVLDLFTHLPGQIVMVTYKVDENLIDNMVAVGIKNGVGPDCYQIVTPFNKTIIWGVFKTLPETDVAKFPTGREKYIFLDPSDNIAKYITLDTESHVPGRKKFTPITDGPRAYEDISTGRTFYLDAYNWSGGGGGEIDPDTIRQIVISIVDGRIDQKLTNYYDKETIDANLDGKVDKAQGVGNAGKYLTVGVDGNVQLTNFELNWVEL